MAGLLRKDDFSSTATYRHAPLRDLFLYRGKSIAGNRGSGDGRGEIRRFRACVQWEEMGLVENGGTKEGGKEGKRTCLPRTVPLFIFFYLADFSPQPTPIFPSHRSSSTFQRGFSRILSTAGNGRGDDPLNRIRLI